MRHDLGCQADGNSVPTVAHLTGLLQVLAPAAPRWEPTLVMVAVISQLDPDLPLPTIRVVRDLLLEFAIRLGALSGSVPTNALTAVYGARSRDDLTIALLRLFASSATPGAIRPACNERVRTALWFAGAHLMDPDLTVGRVASSVGMSASHFQHLIKRESGRSFKQHLRGLRIRLAQILLDTSWLSIKEISTRVGYRYPTELDRDFRRETGCSPREWPHRKVPAKLQSR